MKPITVYRFREDVGGSVIVRLVEHKNKWIVDLRTYDRTGPLEFPTKRGFSLPVTELTALSNAVAAAMRVAREMGLMDLDQDTTRELMS